MHKTRLSYLEEKRSEEANRSHEERRRKED